ncbi:hypothetical protein DQ04_05771020 [Trypanosoma grayi]|uniref:hypothetical protein n=1 Tax=Trypanosoma grayi TaxID=71804 RepID=UPI0004F47A20|nr:hypothetical protein DQ04_05771020 [Trypanosoma grayi]KEG09119.1 hypothetical protein DQ04_05771020 [Trypanosoma grayi]
MPAQMFLVSRRKPTAGDPIKQARPMLHWKLDMVKDTMARECNRVALKPAWLTASRWGETAFLKKGNVADHPGNKGSYSLIEGLPHKFTRATPTVRHGAWL